MMSLPAHASVIVIGGGVMGCSTLYHLAQMGVRDAILLERHRLTSGTTWHSAAQVRALRSSKNLTHLIRYSIDLYQRLQKETGQSVGWINSGSISIACNSERLTHIRRQAALARLFGAHAESISVGEAKERWPLMNIKDVIGAVWSSEDGRVSPSDLCAALIKGARGAQVFENTAVIGIHTRNGKIVGAQTSAGVIRCDAIALCAGLWSRDIARYAGASAPLWPCEHFYLLTKPMAEISGHLPTLSDHDSHLYFRDDSGGLLAGCFEPHGKAISATRLGDNFAFQLLSEDWDHFEPMMINALARAPALAAAEVKTLINGPESFTPDGVFMLGEALETAGLFLGCGMNSVGVATGGGAGYALAHCIVHGYMPMTLPEADPKRFPSCFNSAAALAARAPETLGRHYEIVYPGTQPTTARNLRLPPLTDIWRRYGAHFGQFYGWERPLYFNKNKEPRLTFNRPDWFNQVGKEVKQAHAQAAIFDLSALGKIKVRGQDAEKFLNRICANNLACSFGRVIYTVMLNARGGIESDLIILRLDNDTYRLYTGAAAVGRDWAWLKKQLKDDERVQLSNETEDWAVIGLCGAQATNIATAMGVDDWNRLAFFSHAPSEIGGYPICVARLSYVGEPGWEITCRRQDATAICLKLLDAGAMPSGIFAQNSMRIEKRFLAYGHDMDADITPLEVGLDFAIDWNTTFIGREQLLIRQQLGIDSAIVSIIVDDENQQPLGGEPVYAGDSIIGQTTSAAYGYRLQQPIALAMVNKTPLIDAGNRVIIDIAGCRVGGYAIWGAAFSAN